MDDYLRGSMSFDAFETKFEQQYVGNEEVDALPEDRFSALTDIHEHLEMVSAEPIDVESRLVGYVTAREFRDWLSSHVEPSGRGRST